MQKALLAFALVLVACGGESKPEPVVAKSHVAAPAPPPAEPGPREHVSRTSVDKALRGGLGRFLQLVEVDHVVDAKGKFVGWKVLTLAGPKGTWDGVDVKVGDVVTRVNGFAIEREWQADKAFHSLAVASEIRVSILREGKPLELRFAIVEDEAPPPASSATAAR